MLGTLIGLVLIVILLGVIWWGVQQLMPLIPMAEPFRTILRVLLVVVFAIIVIYFIVVLLGMAGIHVPMTVGGIK